MLAVISDLHLNDGTSGATISPGAFSIFADRLHESALRASWRADGKYRPLTRVDLLILGDGLDMIRSARWVRERRVRPWDDPHTPAFVETVSNITSDILRHNATAISMLRNLTGEGAMALPPANAAGQPIYDAPHIPVTVRIHYMVGNHDWFLHLKGPKYDLLRQSIVQQLGLANPPGEPFPHDANEADELLEVLRYHKVMARHGDIYDPFNFNGHRDSSSLGDCIVVELLSRFAVAVEAQLANELPPATIAGLRELDNVRPLVMVPIWIEGLLERTCPNPAQRRHVKGVWDSLADDFLSLPFVRSRDTWNPNDLVDGLQRALMFSKRLSIGWASSVIEWMNRLMGPARGTSYFRPALSEQDFRNRRARHIVYGHTHHAEVIPLDASHADGYVLNQVYFNSGTWRRVHRPTQMAPDEHEFIASDEMTYLTFFQGDERGGRPYETWSGTLALPPSETSLYRIDSPQAHHAPRQSISTSGLQPRGPHFTLRASETARLSIDEL